MAQTGNREVDDLVDAAKFGPVRRKISEYLDKVPDPTKLFQKKEEKSSSTFKYDGPKEKEAQRKASEAANKKKVNVGNAKTSAATKKPPVKKTIQRKRVAGK
jgi:hypothetical protein